MGSTPPLRIDRLTPARGAPAVAEVALFCGWTHWLRTVVLSERRFVFINLDETMVRHEYQAPSGNVAASQRERLRAANLFFQRTRGGDEKAGTTLVALLSDDPALQPHLPQIWMPKDTERKPMSGQMRRQFEVALDGRYPQQVWGGTTGWMTAPLFGVILRLVHQRVREVLGPEIVIVMVFDAAGAHATVECLQLAAALDIVVILIPGQLTWLLQMLDVKVFSLFKRRLRSDCMRARLHSADGRLPPHAWVPIAVTAVQDLLVDKTWPRAFDSARVPSAEVPADSFRRLQRLAPAIADLPPMPMTPTQIDTILGRHRRGLATALLGPAVRIMPPHERLALRDRLLAEEALALAASAPAPVVAARLALPPLPAAASESIGGRVASRRRSRPDL